MTNERRLYQARSAQSHATWTEEIRQDALLPDGLHATDTNLTTPDESPAFISVIKNPRTAMFNPHEPNFFASHTSYNAQMRWMQRLRHQGWRHLP